MKYALLENSIVTNIIWLHPANADESSNAVPMDDFPVGIGDTYTDGVFYRDGEKLLTPVEQAQTENADMQEALTILGVNTNG